MSNDETRFVTEEGLEKAKTELEELRKKRRDISERIASAKELGDLSENAEYHQAKDDLSFNEGRIAELEDLLLNSVVAKRSNGGSLTVEVGSSVRVTSERGEQEYGIVGVNEADPLRGKVSQFSPLGEAFLGRAVNDIVEVKTPRGPMHYTIVGIS